jgi:hypothetical protein
LEPFLLSKASYPEKGGDDSPYFEIILDGFKAPDEFHDWEHFEVAGYGGD